MLKTPKMIAVKILKWIITCMDKIHFAEPLKDAKSVAGFSVSRQFRVVRFQKFFRAHLLIFIVNKRTEARIFNLCLASTSESEQFDNLLW